MNLLFSYRKGWFVYTPVMMFSIIGLLFILKNKSNNFKAAIIIYMAINIYALSSWWCWWYGGGFGMRSLVQAYAFLAIPLAAFYQFVFSETFKRQLLNIVLKSTTIFLLSCFACLNLIQTYQYDHPADHRLLHYDSMSKAAYWRAFGKFDMGHEEFEKFEQELIHPDNEAAVKGEKRN